MEGKKGWIRIVEVFTAILLIMGVVFTLVGNTYLEKTDYSPEIYEKQTAVLREIELSNSLRNEIMDVASLPVEWANFNSSGLSNLQTKIIEKTPNNFDCEAKLCVVNDDCILSTTSEEDIYAQSVIVFANTDTYNPRQLKLFCWKSESFIEEIISAIEGYIHKNSSGEDTVSLNPSGNIILGGNCISGGSCDNPPEDSFIIKGPSGNVAYIDSDGNICVENGDCSDLNPNCDSPVGESFIIKNDGTNVIYIDSTGDLCLTGSLTESGNP